MNRHNMTRDEYVERITRKIIGDRYIMASRPKIETLVNVLIEELELTGAGCPDVESRPCIECGANVEEDCDFCECCRAELY